MAAPDLISKFRLRHTQQLLSNLLHLELLDLAAARDRHLCSHTILAQPETVHGRLVPPEPLPRPSPDGFDVGLLGIGRPLQESGDFLAVLLVRQSDDDGTVYSRVLDKSLLDLERVDVLTA